MSHILLALLKRILSQKYFSRYNCQRKQRGEALSTT